MRFVIPKDRKPAKKAVPKVNPPSSFGNMKRPLPAASRNVRQMKPSEEELAKRRKRAQRFGMSSEALAAAATLPGPAPEAPDEEELEKRRKRGERWGIDSKA